MGKRKPKGTSTGPSDGDAPPTAPTLPKAPSQPAVGPPGDQAVRDRLVAELDKTFLVEAAAGTGKTTSMVGRMTALLRAGRCEIGAMAAVTFTKKAAAELRARFQTELERALRSAREAGETEAADRLQTALAHIDQAAIGTIHAFCARLLRARPVEAGVPLGFRELDDEVDFRLRYDAWQQYLAMLFATDHPLLAELDSLGITGLLTKREDLLEELNELGLDVSQLVEMFYDQCEYPDVEQWPAAKVELPPLEGLLAQLEAYIQHMTLLAPTFPAERGRDQLMGEYERIPRLWRRVHRHRTSEVMNLLGRFRDITVVQKHWPRGAPQGKVERDRWQAFCQQVQPYVDRWLEKRYEAILRAIRPAQQVYDHLRRQAGGLNFQDLLLAAARMLRNQPAIRQYFRRRFTHLLVDEFQDTDPIQAEVMLLLTADDPAESHWKRCRPVPGSLFVVGDPKQSIYRFRRADIVTYNQVREIIVRSGGEVVSLAANFRTIAPLVDWVNGVFDGLFPPAATLHRPANCPLLVGRRADPEPGELPPELCGLKAFDLTSTPPNADALVTAEAAAIARHIAAALATGATVPRTTGERERGVSSRATPGDFLIVTWHKKYLAAYAQALERQGIPHQVTGGSALQSLSEAHLLAQILTAVNEPENPVALVAALRGELFGISDPALYAFKHAGGRFDFRAELPPGESAPLAAAIERLRRYAHWLRRLPLVSALERMAIDLGLFERALADGGNVRAGSLARLFERLREDERAIHSPAELVELFQQMLETNAEFDGAPARPASGAVVRVMNLHKVKGLEAPVVFLAGPAGYWEPLPQLYIDRTGEQVRGYAAIHAPRRDSFDFHPQLLARPAGWDAHQAAEAAFATAERERLLYVAATRAGAMLVTSRCDNPRSPWKQFGGHLSTAAMLDLDSGAALPLTPAEEPVRVLVEDVAAAQSDIAVRWQHAWCPTYAAGGAKRLSVTGEAVPFEGREGGGMYGPEWGTVIHRLLEAVHTQGAAGLEDLARDALEEADLKTTLAPTAIQMVRRVMRSAIWQRAQQSSQRLTETPFHLLAGEWLPASVVVPGVPLVIAGAIDLAFRQAGGWVVVDYKTDSAPMSRVAALVEHYRGQIETYAAAWTVLTGEPVIERGLYFTDSDTYVTV